MHCRLMHVCFMRPGPPNFFMSLQKLHSPHSVLVHGSQRLHLVLRCRRTPDAAALDPFGGFGGLLKLGSDLRHWEQMPWIEAQQSVGSWGLNEGVYKFKAKLGKLKNTTLIKRFLTENNYHFSNRSKLNSPKDTLTNAALERVNLSQNWELQTDDKNLFPTAKAARIQNCHKRSQYVHNQEPLVLHSQSHGHNQRQKYRSKCR